MSRFFIYATLALCLGATATLAVTNRNVSPNPDAEARLAANGAFRDGLYLGKLAAASAQPQRAAIGRWSTDEDRSMFAAGYRRGYTTSLADSPAKGEATQATE
jgi:hypothetical protein